MDGKEGKRKAQVKEYLLHGARLTQKQVHVALLQVSLYLESTFMYNLLILSSSEKLLRWKRLENS